MGREVRRVPANWQHPTDDRGRYIALLDRSYSADAAAFLEKYLKEGLQAAIEEFGSAPDRNRYMPEWSDAERTHLMMYENTSEGSPISPAFATPEELARWLADTGASAFAANTATYEQWLAVCRRGWAPSAVIVDGQLVSGVSACGNLPDNKETKA